MGLLVRITSLDTPPSVRILCDSPDALTHANLTINNQRVLQIEDLAFGDYKHLRDTGNRLNEVSFEVKRGADDSDTPFADAAEALVWAMDHVEDCPVLGAVEFTLSAGGAGASRWFERGAVQAPRLVRQIGTSLYLQYTIIGGAFLKALP